MNIDSIMKELAEYIRMQEEAAAMVESLKDQLKERMTAAGGNPWRGQNTKPLIRRLPPPGWTQPP